MNYEPRIPTNWRCQHCQRPRTDALIAQHARFHKVPFDVESRQCGYCGSVWTFDQHGTRTFVWRADDSDLDRYREGFETQRERREYEKAAEKAAERWAEGNF